MIVPFYTFAIPALALISIPIVVLVAAAGLLRDIMPGKMPNLPDKIYLRGVLYVRAPDPAELKATLPPSDDRENEKK